MKNALLCFLKYPEPGHVKTRLAVDISPESAAELYTFLVERIITEIFTIEEKYDIFLMVDTTHEISKFKAWLGDHWNFEPQHAGDLGQRLSHAVSNAFAEGYDRVMVIGSDCIGMDETFIGKAFDALDDHDFVIGPSSDGGYYLLGLSEEKPWIFENVAWSTETVLETTLDRIENREMTVHQLEEKLDIDTADDLDRFRKSLPEEHFLAHKIDQIILEVVSRVGTDGKDLGLMDEENYHTQVLNNVVIETTATDVPEEEPIPAIPAQTPEPRGAMNIQNLFGQGSGKHDKKPGR